MKFPFFVSISLALVSGPSLLVALQEGVVLGKRSEIQLSEPHEELIRLQPGAHVLERPHPRAPILDIIRVPTEVLVLERQGAWVKVLHGSWQGWILPRADPPSQGTPLTLGNDPDEARLSRARSLLGEETRSSGLGPYSLFTDITDTDLLERLSEVADHLPRVYRDRFGLDPGEQSREAVVIFSREQAYRQFEASEPAIATVDTGGFTSTGLTILFSGDREVDEIVRILLHELTHLLNHRTLGLETPAWLEEGMAEDLAFSRVDDAGRIHPGSLGGTFDQGLTGLGRAGIRYRFEVAGAKGSLTGLLIAWGEPDRPTLIELLSMPWQEFVAAEDRALRYAQSAFLIRYLLDGRTRSLRRGFLSYLEALSSSELRHAESLWDHVAEDPGVVEQGLFRWLHNQARANGLPLPRRGSL